MNGIRRNERHALMMELGEQTCIKCKDGAIFILSIKYPNDLCHTPTKIILAYESCEGHLPRTERTVENEILREYGDRSLMMPFWPISIRTFVWWRGDFTTRQNVLKGLIDEGFKLKDWI